MSVTPDFIGQRYKDTNTGNIWIANSTTPGDWTLEVQNMQMKWTPRTLKLAEMLGLLVYDNWTGITSLTFEQVTLSGDWDIEPTASNITAISFPNATSLVSSTALTIANNPSLLSISMPNLVNAVGKLEFYDDVALSTIVLTNWLPSDVGINAGGCNLSAATVNHILARGVAEPSFNGVMTLNGGTNAAPTGQGILDKATLIGRGGTINTN